jgi:hypothetical protein
MIYRKIYINKWTAHFYFAIQHYWIEEIEGKMQSLGASRKVLDRVVRNMRKNEMNTGFTYSKPSKRESIVVVGRSSSGGEFLNSSTHEIRHLVDDIAKEDNMQMSGEGVAYLTGDIVNQLADIISKFSCECCRNE